MLRIKETTNTTATQLLANTSATMVGKTEKMAGTLVKPRPMLKERATMMLFLCENPQLLIIRIPLETI